jgi:uncharacterized protein
MEIRDPIYGFIKINEFEKEIIDTSTFQRLRRIQQLALSSMAYPGAVHTRFEHSLGVMHLAGLMYDSIIEHPDNRELLHKTLPYGENKDELKDELKRDRQLIRIAALLHDVGHAPFSHAANAVIPEKSPGVKFKHDEDYTPAAIRGPLKDDIERSPFNEFDISAEQIAELFEQKRLGGEKAFWKQIIDSQLDADRGDFLLRDSHHAGVKYGVYDFWRLLNTLTLGRQPEEPNDIILGVNDNGLRVAESFIIARYLTYTQVTYHKTRRAFDYHLANAMTEIIDGTLPTPTEIDEYLKFDDLTILNEIRAKKDSSEDCEAIWYRRHVRCVHSDELEKAIIKPEDIQDKQREVDEVRTLLEREGIGCYPDELVDEWWYKKGDPYNEIKIISNAPNKAKVQLLSNRSPIVRDIGRIVKWRLFVMPKDKIKAENVLNKR